MEDAESIDWLRALPVSTPSGKVQGVLIDRILIPRSAADDPDSYSLIQANLDYANWAMQSVRLVPGEFPQQSLWSYYVDYYRAQVSNGGHAQFVKNSRMTELTMGCCLRGLRAMGANEHHSIFEKLVDFFRNAGEKTLDDELQSRVDESASVLKALDGRYFERDSTTELVEKNSAWLRSLPCFGVMDDDALSARIEALESCNPLMAARADEENASRRAVEENTPLYRVLKSLCAAAGRTFLRPSAGAFLPMTMVSTAAPDRKEFCWGMLTDRGVHHAFFYVDRGFFRTKRVAVLWAKDERKPLASITLTAEDYDSIVPAAGRS